MMPIKPENRALYPKDWPAIRAERLKFAGHRCEHEGCGARNYSVGWWFKDAGIWQWRPAWGQNDNPRTFSEAKQAAAELHWNRSEEGPPPTVIVLTIAHLNHDPTDCSPDNLRALCQRHHLAHDHDHHRANSQATRRAKARTLEMF